MGNPAPIPSNSVPIVLNNPDFIFFAINPVNALDGELPALNPEEGAISALDDDDMEWFLGGGVLTGLQQLAYSGVALEDFGVQDDFDECNWSNDSEIDGMASMGIAISVSWTCINGEGQLVANINSIDWEYPDQPQCSSPVP